MNIIIQNNFIKFQEITFPSTKHLYIFPWLFTSLVIFYIALWSDLFKLFVSFSSCIFNKKYSKFASFTSCNSHTPVKIQLNISLVWEFQISCTKSFVPNETFLGLKIDNFCCEVSFLQGVFQHTWLNFFVGRVSDRRMGYRMVGSIWIEHGIIAENVHELYEGKVIWLD